MQVFFSPLQVRHSLTMLVFQVLFWPVYISFMLVRHAHVDPSAIKTEPGHTVHAANSTKTVKQALPSFSFLLFPHYKMKTYPGNIVSLIHTAPPKYNIHDCTCK